MSQTLTEIAQQLQNNNKKTQLIYAFNGTGKTRLSRAFKDLVSPKEATDAPEQSEISQPKILYYSAFTEDLFYWDNDLTSDEQYKLKIQRNSFTDWVLQEQGQDQNIIEYFQRFSNGKLTPKFNAQYTLNHDDGQQSVVKAFSEVTFSMQGGDDSSSGNLKISKGEESYFIWSIFYTLLSQVIAVLDEAEAERRETNQFDQLRYVYIDDPVSSLDENHLIELAVSLAQLIKAKGTAGLKFIISTHSTLFYNVLYNEVNKKACYILSRFDDGSYVLEAKDGDSNKSFSYHLHIKSLIEKAIATNSVQKYHIALLRNLYEKTANFLGYAKWSDLLPRDQQKAYATRVMNLYPHNSLSNDEIAEPTAPEKAMVKYLLKNLNQYGYWQQEVTDEQP